VLSDGGLIPTPDQSATGSAFTVAVPGGNFVTLTLLPPPQASPNPCDDFEPFTLPAVPVIAGYTTALGQVTWLSEAALGANGIGPCALKDGGSGVGSTTGGTTGGTSGGTGGGPGWLDAGYIPWNGGSVAQTTVFPFTPDGGRLVAWLAGPSGQYDLYYATNDNGYAPTALTDGGDVAAGTLSGTQLGDGVLLTYSTSSGSNTTSCEFISSTTGPAGAVTPSFPVNLLSGLGSEETTTFTGQLNGTNGAFVLQPEVIDAGIVGAFTIDGTAFGNSFTLSPATPEQVVVLTLIGTSCNISDFAGGPGFCLAGSGEIVDPDAGAEFVAFISSVDTSGAAPAIKNTQTLAVGQLPLIYIGLTTLPGKVAVVVDPFGSPNPPQYWELSSLASPPGSGLAAPAQTDVLINWDDNVLALSLANFQNTAGIFLPDGGEPPPPPSIPSLVNGAGSNFPAAFYEPATDSVITAGVPLSDDTSGGNITVWQLPRTF